MDTRSKRREILLQLDTARAEFHQLLDSLSEQDFQRQSLNPGWTNGEILAHMTFGFMIVDVLLPMTRPPLGQIAERIIQVVCLVAELIYRSFQLVQCTWRPWAGKVFYAQANWKDLRPGLFFSSEES